VRLPSERQPPGRTITADIAVTIHIRRAETASIRSAMRWSADFRFWQILLQKSVEGFREQ
jgi:hypothetical protein